jgi:hypothetical protein
MHRSIVAAAAACFALAFSTRSLADGRHERGDPSIQVGVRPAFLVAGMQDTELKRRLLSCQHDLVRRTKFSIAHRGAPLQFPEHTKESYECGRNRPTWTTCGTGSEMSRGSAARRSISTTSIRVPAFRR